MAGPTIEASWKLSWLSAMADGRRSGGTRRGMADERAGWSTDDSPAATNATANRAPTGGAAGQREQDEGEAAGGQTGLGHEQEPAAVDGVGKRARAQREEQDRDELEEGQRGDREGRPVRT